MAIWSWKEAQNIYEERIPKAIVGFDDFKIQSKESKCWAVVFSKLGKFAIAVFGKRIRLR